MTDRFNESLTPKVQNSLYCSTCNTEFLIKDLILKGSRCPLLMQCGHSTCEYCIQQSLKTSKSMKCQQCGLVLSLESTDLKYFSFNLYLLGSLIALQNSKLEEEKKLTALTRSYGNFEYEIKKQSNEVGGRVCEECSLNAFWYCENCQCYFCEICWAKVHGLRKSLMKHCRTSIEIANISKEYLKKCPEHETQNLEFYCKSCSTIVCSYCFILRHQGEGHSLITLKEKNEEIVNTVKIAAEKADHVVKTMRITFEELKLMQCSAEVLDTKLISNLECQIRRNFFRFHGLLQLEEEKLLKKLHGSLNQRENSMKALQLQLESQIKDIERLLREFEYVVKRPDNADLTNLHQQLEEVQKLPCFLIKKKPLDKEPKVEFDERFLESLQLYCTLDLPPQETFELSSYSNLPQGNALQTVNIFNTERKLLESSASDNETLSNCSSQDLPLKERNEPNIFHERKNYAVRVSYIKNPGEFYVKLRSQQTKQEAINKEASLLAGFSDAVSGPVAKDEIYLVKYEVDNKWYRGRVIEIVPPQKNENELCVTVYYIDFGNSETVPLSRLRPIFLDMLELPPLAVKCKLYDCVPRNGEWCENSTMTMEKILRNYTATMFVHKIHRDCLEVDLSVIYPEGEIGREIVSVCDALYFLEFSSFMHGPKSPLTTTATNYPNETLPYKSETLDVVITHVNSPIDFYVQKIWQSISYLHKLNIDLQNYYSENLEEGIIHKPSKGTPCAALFSVDQKWYRAKIVGVRRNKMVRVMYVDYGNKEILPRTSIRKLKRFFIQRPPLAINCELTGFSKSVGWSNYRMCSYLKSCAMVKNCRIFVDDYHQKEQKLKVFLYEQINGKEVCLNTLFADKNDSNVIQRSKSEEELEEEEEEEGMDEMDDRISNKFKTDKKPVSDDEDGATFMTSHADDSLRIFRVFKNRMKNRLNAKKLRELHEFEKKNCSEMSSTEVVENEVDEYDNNKLFKVQVQILSAESPSCIYVTFSALMEKYKSLQVKLNEFYKDFTSSPKELTINSVCAVFQPTENCWFRALVFSILPEGLVKVFLKDVAQICTVPASALRELDPSFKKFVTCAIKCHLADIRPPGKYWPGISSEFLLNELENSKEIYITKKGEIENKSLPVELWIKKVVTRGALEPTTIKWITLNKLLVSEGLAVSSKQEVLCCSVPSNTEQCSDDKKESDPEYLESAPEIEPTEKDIKEEEKNISDALTPSLNVCWLSPEPIEKSHFVGIPTYVDCNAYVYIYDVEEDEKLKMIRDVLQLDYNDSEPNFEDNNSWSAGQLCIAKYHVDGFWYRGQIIRVKENLSYEVLFVDYGNVETCQVTELRKSIKMLDVPILSHKLQLQDIAPVSEDGKWPLSVVEILHSLVVNKLCEVKIFKPTLHPNEPNIASLKVIDNNVDVGTFLVDRNLAFYTSIVNSSSDTQNEKVLLCEEDFSEPLRFSDDSKISKFYISLNIPDDCDGFFMRVTTVISEAEFFARLINDTSYPSSLKNVLKQFKSFQKKLNQECHLQPPFVEKFVEGHPCCCIHSEDNNWSRGEIVRLLQSDDLVSVFYVDHGSTASVSKSSIRECKSEWLSFPKMALKCRLANIERSPNVSESVFTEAFITCVQQTSLFAEILSKHEEVLTVRLLSEKNGALAYQKLIDDNLIKFVETDEISREEEIL